MSQLRLHPDGRNTVRAAVTPAEPYPPIVVPAPARRTESSACLGVIIALAAEVAAGLIFVALVGTLLALLKAVGL